MRLTLAELATHKVFARFDPGDTVTITVLNATTGVVEVLGVGDDDCSETNMPGVFEWDFGFLAAQPTSLTQYVWSMDNGSTTQDGTVEAGGYPDTLDELIANPSGVAAIETPWIVGNLLAGGSVTLKLYNSTGVEEVLDDSDCTEFVSGFYRWSTSNMHTYPSSLGSYMWIMTDGSRYTWGLTTIGTPEDIGEVTADAVWDALTADHLAAASFGRFVQDIPTAEENRQEMDSNSIQLSSIRGTAEDVLEDTGTTIPATITILEDKIDFLQDTASDILTDTGTTLPATLTIIEGKVDTVDGVVDNIYIDTQRVDGLIEDSGGDRFTEKALEEAPIATMGEVWDELRVDHTDAGSFGEGVLAEDLNAAAQATVNAEVDSSIETYNLDHLLAVAIVGGDVVDNSAIAQLASKDTPADWDTFNNTTDSLEAIADATSASSDNPVKYSGLRFAIANFRTGDAVTIVVYNPDTGLPVGIESDVCFELGTSGCFYWSTENFTPGDNDTYLWIMDNGATTKSGEFNFGDYEQEIPQESSSTRSYRFRST